jgi:hypothetical protein
MHPEENIPMHQENGHEAGHGDIHMPPPSIWPVILALGAAVLAMGLVCRGPVLVIGLLIFLAAFGGWVFEDELKRLRRR